MPFLYSIHPDGSAISRCVLRHRALVIGRDEGADVVVADEFLSREHFMVIPEAEGVIIRDLDSKNGTWVNGRRVTEHPLRPGERIEAGRSLFALEPGLETMIAELSKLSWLPDRRGDSMPA